MTPRVSIIGTGAVSPAGWGVPSLLESVRLQQRPALSELTRESNGSTITTPVLRVPDSPGSVPKFSRLRRASAISKFAAAAVAEALPADRLAQSQAGVFRIGVVTVLMNGCVNYSNRFYGEVLHDPATASPILFPETVFNAPSSHLSAFIGSTAPNDTLIGDGAEFFTGIELATEWLLRGEVDGCLVVGNEEIDWLSAEALRFYSRQYIPSEGAAALYLELGSLGPSLHKIPESQGFLNHLGRMDATRRLIESFNLPPSDPNCLWVDGCCGVARHDIAENSALPDWNGGRLSPRKILGEAFGASAAFQCVLAVEALRQNAYTHAFVTSAGGNEQASGASFTR